MVKFLKVSLQCKEAEWTTPDNSQRVGNIPTDHIFDCDMISEKLTSWISPFFAKKAHM